MQDPVELTAAFRANGLKLTPQRQLLFRLLHDNETHPSAEALYVAAAGEMPGISLRTVYQTLTDLVAMGELRQINLDSGSARFDPNVDDHHHLLCTRCGDVRDVYVDGVDQLSLGELDGFRINATDVVFRGTCSPCRIAARPRRAAATVSTLPTPQPAQQQRKDP